MILGTGRAHAHEECYLFKHEQQAPNRGQRDSLSNLWVTLRIKV